MLLSCACDAGLSVADPESKAIWSIVNQVVFRDSGLCMKVSSRDAAPPSGSLTVAGNTHVLATGTASRLAVPVGTTGTIWATVGRCLGARNQSMPSPKPAMASTGSQLEELSLWTVWATTGDTVLVTVSLAGQNRSLKPAGSARLIVALSLSKAEPRPP